MTDEGTTTTAPSQDPSPPLGLTATTISPSSAPEPTTDARRTDAEEKKEEKKEDDPPCDRNQVLGEIARENEELMRQGLATWVSELQDDDLAPDMSAIQKEVEEQLAQVIKAAHEQDTERGGREGEADGRVLEFLLDNLRLTLDNIEDNHRRQDRDNPTEPTTSTT